MCGSIFIAIYGIKVHKHERDIVNSGKRGKIKYDILMAYNCSLARTLN